MVSLLIDKLKAQKGTVRYSGAQPEHFFRLETELALTLPTEHKRLLEWSNGIETYNGFDRIFSVYGEGPIDSVVWNDYECWKFSWGPQCLAYWCFGESAWGHQYAYKRDELVKDGTPCVYELSAFGMDSDVIAASFSEFFQRCLTRPYGHFDGFERLAHEHFGPLSPNVHLAYVPPLGILPQGGMYELENVVVMPARAAMICNGDNHVQMSSAPANAVPAGFETYEDEKGRARLRILWE